jgi:hypothetical protein
VTGSQAAPWARRLHHLEAFVAMAGVSVVAWLGWLGWHEKKYRVPGTRDFQGPYQAWQVIALTVTLAVAVAIASWFGFSRASVVAASTATTLMFSLDAVTQLEADADMWPIGALLLLVGCLLGLGLVGLVVFGLRTRLCDARLGAPPPRSRASP